MCVLTYIHRHTCNLLVCCLFFRNIVHIEYVTHTCGHVSEVASKVNGGGNHSCSCSIKHLIMMSDTVALLLSKVERRLYSLILNNIFNFYYSLSYTYRLLFFIIKWMSIVFNCSTDVQKKNITLPIVFSLFLFLQCIYHVFWICYACLDLKERLNLHFQAIGMIYHVFLYTKNVCWWDVISDADVFHTRSMHSLCVCVFFARLVH